MLLFVIVSIFIGFSAGFLGGQFGMGGGLITTPAIRLLLQQPALIAVGTPLPIIIPTALSGFYNYQKNKFVDYKKGLIIGLVGAFFSILGARLTLIVGGSLILIITAVLIALMSLRFLRPPQVSRGRPCFGGVSPSRRDVPLLRGNLAVVITGAVAGFMSGLLGLGGGLVIIPALTILFGKGIKEAFGTSLLAIIFIAIPGSITHYLLGNVKLTIALFITLGVMPGAFLGSRLTVSLPSRTVNILFGIYLLVTAVYLAINELFLI